MSSGFHTHGIFVFDFSVSFFNWCRNVKDTNVWIGWMKGLIMGFDRKYNINTRVTNNSYSSIQNMLWSIWHGQLLCATACRLEFSPRTHNQFTFVQSLQL